ncbi:brain-specific angiogenesis inhibitor 1-associated protein 2 isoform X2 [Plodia interpunctella]|uniref:brain-specific angiogenesis inhibitor 1-associated protein 2 isoform X2 n=1 Tax=Plodia interpunctella TaxID=58824 RepID=UPI0023675CC8|nr:brain-specific angiogenesis inhibitor 1-associated protein 2 isoform X2 [Plodia interpunctella]
METEELTKLVDGIYKNILDKFNPGARQMITAGKAYLKALHGAAAASRLYVDAVGKLGRQAQQGTWGGCADIGTALMKVVEVYREIQDQQMNILKAFYVDLLVPLETNLEKDTKVVQSEQKRFLQQHKLRSESYSKAAATIKKQRKKKTNVTKVGSAMDKEMKNMQILEEEKTKLDAFCEQSLKNAMTQERRRYGFVLERQCSLAKHWLAYHAAGAASYNSGLEEWLEVSRTREFLPPNVEAMFVSRMRQVSFWADEEVYASPRAGDDDDRASVGSALRKTRSVDASCLDVRSIGDLGSPAQGLSRAKSDFNLQASLHTGEQDPDARAATRPSSLAPPSCTTREPPLARALYAYAAAGDNQLSFQQGDVLALLGERTKGWQYGENLRTHHAGWFPLAYTEPIANDENPVSSPARWSCAQTPNEGPPPAPVAHAQTTPSTPSVHAHHPPARMFGDTVTAHHVNKGRLGSSSPGLPPTLPAPSPSVLSSSASATFHTSTPAASTTAIKNSTSAASFTTHAVIETRSFGPQTLPMRSQVAQNKAGPPKTVVSAVGAVGNVSLHSSNDSGFSNEPPPQPDVDYSDEEAQRLRVPIRPQQFATVKLRKALTNDRSSPAIE